MKHPVEGKAVTMKDYFAGDAKSRGHHSGDHGVILQLADDPAACPGLNKYFIDAAADSAVLLIGYIFIPFRLFQSDLRPARQRMVFADDQNHVLLINRKNSMDMKILTEWFGLFLIKVYSVIMTKRAGS